jgi:uncharacterized membrane protein YgcG
VNNPVRRYDFVQKLEWFLISGVVMILVIRTQLWLTNYPQLGGGGLHIAHLLYGGIFMLIAIWFALIYLNRWSRSVAAVVGGIGFGFFIDELGKFITEDNDYFFKPAAGIIYIIFIVIRELSRRQQPDPQTALANALSFMPSTVTGEFRRDEYEVSKQLLDQADQDDPLVAQTRAHFEQVTLAPTKPPSKAAQAVARVHGWIAGLTEKRKFGPVVITVLILWAFFSFASASEIQFDLGAIDQDHDAVPDESHGMLGAIRSVSILASVVFVGIGVFRMRRDEHQRAYRAFSYALLISIFVTRVVSFIEAQFAAVFGLGLDLVLYAAISELASQDSQKKRHFGGLGNSRMTDGEGEGSDGGRGGTGGGSGPDGQNGGDGEEKEPQAASP